MNSTNNYQSQTVQASEKLVITPYNEDDVLEQLRKEIEQIRTEIGQAEQKGLAQRLGFKKSAENAIISVGNNGKTTSSMNEIIHPSPDLREALSLALDATPVGDLKNLILDDDRNEKKELNRVGDALAARANALVGPAAPEAEVIRQTGGHSVLPSGERMLLAMSEVRGNTKELVAARHTVISQGAQ